MKSHWMIYGANGYTAQLAIEKAVAQGRTPILAGRNRAAIEPLAEKYDLQSRIFDLTNRQQLTAELEDVKVVSHCAGPYSATAEPMMRACIQSGTHYTDITGEIDVFLLSQSLDEEARASGAVLCPGVGFDVIPTDCVAAKLKEALPDATELDLGFQGDASLSPGTAKTMVEGISQGMKVLRDGELIRVPPSFEARSIDFGTGPVPASVIPWGDLATAYWQTGIPNISVYSRRRVSKAADLILPIIQTVMKSSAVQRLAKQRIERRVTGPDEANRARRPTHVWGEARNANGDSVTCRVETPNGYTVTMDGILLSAHFLMNYEGEGGCFTPAQLMGTELVERLPGAGELQISGI
jgi:short subunit dehydrogenase-like uncharacterized protein